LLCGGNSLSDSCYAPTVLFDPPADARVSTAEVFGPVVCVYPYDEMDEAIARANSLRFSFQVASSHNSNLLPDQSTFRALLSSRIRAALSKSGSGHSHPCRYRSHNRP